MRAFSLRAVTFTEEQQQFRQQVRLFLQQQLQQQVFKPTIDSWLNGYSSSFSQKLASKGWIGMTWLKQYGGQEKSILERYILTEELLIAGAPVSAHWFADRQQGPLLLRYGTEWQKQFFLPKIAAGTCYFAIGLSEPNSGSDLASVKTAAKKVAGGYIVNGMKTWTSGAHHAHYILALVRTSPVNGNKKHDGLSQLIIDLHAPGVTIKPIRYLTGAHHFNEVFFEDVFVPEKYVVGQIGQGWAQGLAELAYERSGPERILSTVLVLQQFLQQFAQDEQMKKKVLPLIVRLWSLRNLSIGVAKMLEEGLEVNVEAALVKSLGTEFEQMLPEFIRQLYVIVPNLRSDEPLERYLAEAILHAPGFTLRGGTTEILNGLIVKGVVQR